MSRAPVREIVRTAFRLPIASKGQRHGRKHRVVYLMRGLPSCGKSTTARHLAGERGVVLETDAYFVQADGSFRYSEDELALARQWNLDRFQTALASGQSPIVVDRGNGVNAESQCYARLALKAGYQVEVREPNSPWWQELRVLLRYRPHTDALLDIWADELARLSRSTHAVPRETIRDWMEYWANDVTIDDILAYSCD